MKLKLNYLFLIISCLFLASSCKQESYSEKLKKEKNWIQAFLDGRVVVRTLPVDNKFITVDEVGEANAPYYELSNGVYMQVISPGTKEVGMAVKADTDKEIQGTLVLFTYSQYKIENNELYVNYLNVGYTLDFRFGASETPKYGLAIEEPLNYLYRNAKVKLVVPSKYGFTDMIGSVTPYLYTVYYFKEGNS